MTINTLIVDDEKPAREELAFLLKSFPEVHLVAQGKNGLEAVNLIREHAPDLVFLDVQMPGLDGFGVLQRLVERRIEVPHVVFATAFDHYAVKAFDVNAVDYVLKPFDRARIAKALQRARREIESEVSPADRLEQLVARLGAIKNPPAKNPSAALSKILVNAQQKLLLIDADDMIFATIGDGLISIITRELEGTSNHRTLDELEDALASDSFFRAHRSFLVNIHHIQEVVPWFKSTFMLKMNDKKHTEIPVSRTQTKRLRELFKL
jgi:two-component system response regulator LytT